MRRKILENENFEKREVHSEEIQNKNGIQKSKTEKWSCENCAHGDGKNRRERRFKSEKLREIRG